MGLKEDLEFGEVGLIESTFDEDAKRGIDIWVGNLPVAWRKRRIPLTDWNDITIRYSRPSGIPTEYEKMLNGECGALLYVYEYIDAFVICCVSDIIQCLRNGKYKIQPPSKEKTRSCSITLNDINYLLIPRIYDARTNKVA